MKKDGSQNSVLFILKVITDKSQLQGMKFPLNYGLLPSNKVRVSHSSYSKYNKSSYRITDMQKNNDMLAMVMDGWWN